ncbi:Outer membrane receptor proteins, mostly Fe transport [Pustulibacterium marinum]|uniref:Outer membrane receptor proteins, mostly Fe transport n=1 Tax=Pustulibacterium marinum TaxID=1224947 RepID=A0A1I7HC59_9FLAO|nr:TonB-dependent receptor [Pustulibacterium marinum]SFU58308.1 Outer membrane receptor proteins, mostly Fe transport [Pustulibacterium marinum]
MKAIKNLILTAAFLLVCAVGFSQVTGTVVDGQSGTPLPGASVMVKGTNNGTSTDFDGKFTISASNPGTLVITYVGFITKEVTFSSTKANLGTISIQPNAEELEGVVVIGSGVIDLENDRQTPIAVSTIGASEIQARAVGNVEFPEIMKNTPNVYVSNQSGGFGEAQMSVRGFGQSNTAFLLNGQPINGMEDGNMYWSNWSGLADIANAVQVQRGLGSSKLAISSVGGTVNIVTKATDLKEGGYVRAMVGNDSFFKGTATYNTGLNDKGWGFSFLLDYWQAHSSWADGTKGQGQNYFFSVGKKIGDKHTLNFLLIGAPQYHDQNYSKALTTSYRNDGTINYPGYDIMGIKGNSNYGFLNGEYLSMRRNYYHKPVMNLNWDYNISETSLLSVVGYASFGRGGGTGTYGSGVNYLGTTYGGQYGGYTANGNINWDGIYAQNQAAGISDGFNSTILRSSVNNHAWYGTVANYENNDLENWTFNVGADIRFYKGDHFRQITDLLGTTGRVSDLVPTSGNIITNTFDADPWAALFNYADEGDRIDYDYSENINYQGVFGQVEYHDDAFSVFAQAAVSNQSYQREDRGNFEVPRESYTILKTGYNVKGGGSYNIAENHKVYANIGKYSRQPFLDNVYPSYDDNTLLSDPEVSNEEIFGLEAGYSFSTSDFNLNINAYLTQWDNRFFSNSGTYDLDGDGVDEIANATFLFTNISQLHQGLELDFKYTPTLAWMLRGYATIGDWRYNGESPVIIRNNDTAENIDNLNVDLDGTRVGTAPQASLGLGTSYSIIQNKLKVNADWNYYNNFYGFVDVEDVSDSGLVGGTYQPEHLKPYSLIDLGASYKFMLGENDLSLNANVYNVLDHTYINQADSYGYFYGRGRTWNFSVKYRF